MTPDPPVERQLLIARLARLWRRLTEPHPAILEPGHRSRARLLSSLLLGLTALSALFSILWLVEVQWLGLPRPDPYELILIPGLGMLIGMYLLSRTRHYRLAALSFTGLGIILVFFDIIAVRESTLDIAYLIFGVLMSSLFFSWRTTALILAGLMLSVFALPWLTPGLTWGNIGNAETFLAVIGLLIITIAALRQQDQRRVEAQARTLAEREAALRASQALFQQLFESAPDAIVVADREGRVVRANAKTETLFGYRSDELHGQPVEILLPERFRPGHVQHRAGYTANPRARPMGAGLELFGRRQDGGEFPVAITLGPLETDEGLLVLSIIRDVTERRQAEEQLRLSARQMVLLNDITRAALDTPDLPAMLQTLADRLGELFEADGCYLTLWDEAGQRMIPTAASGPARETYPTFIIQPGEATLTASVLHASHTLTVEDVFHSPYLSPRIAAQFPARSLLGLPLIADGQKLGAALIGFNQPHHFTPDEIALGEQAAGQIALAMAKAQLFERLGRHAADLEQRVAERTRELETANRDLQSALTARQEFLARTSHELRTPLNAILGFAQVMELADLDPRQQANVKYILKAGRRLLDLVNHVLDITRLETGQISLSLEPVSVSGLVQETVELIQPLAAERSIQLRVAELPPGAHVRADRHRLGQVLLNLLANAVKYNRAGGAVTVDCAARPDDRWRLNVRDTGPGLSTDQMARLFNPFDRLGAEHTEEPGAGLGLALSKRLIEAMGGGIGADSTAGSGSTFWIELARVESPALSLGESEAAPGPAPTRSVLHIEDNLSNLRLLEQILVYRPGVKLITAMQGRLGLDLAREHQPDLILLDLHLPDLPGLQVLLMLRSDPRTQAIPVVVISADATPHQIERLLAAGARAYLTKPLDVPQFLKTVDDLVAGG